MNTDVTRKQLQSKQKSDSYTGRFKLDTFSRSALNRAINHHFDNGIPTSQNVVMRRALRVYAEHLNNLQTDEQRKHEVTELRRAAKGIL